MQPPDSVTTESVERSAELRLPAVLDELAAARGMVTVVATSGDFTLDEISDITVATGEVCTRLIRAAEPGAELVLTVAAGDRFRLRAHTRTRAGHTPDVTDFGWHVLVTVTDEITVIEPEPGQFGTTIEFVKSRGADQ